MPGRDAEVQHGVAWIEPGMGAFVTFTCHCGAVCQGSGITTIAAMLGAHIRTYQRLVKERDEARRVIAAVEALCDDRFGDDTPVPVWRSEDVRALLRAALASGDGTGVCRHCGDPIRRGESGDWAHVMGSGSILYNCQHTVPYGQRAEPASGDGTGEQ